MKKAIAILAIALSACAHAEPAHWTGRANYGNMNGRFIVECEYRTGMRTFWIIFSGGACKSFIDTNSI